MTIEDVRYLLHMVERLEGRDISSPDIHAWYAVIGDLDETEVRAAMVAHYRVSTERLMPAHVVRYVQGSGTVRTDSADGV